ncbi:MAG: hypothetical protein ABIR03_11375 [Ginsengibacter sp.]
MKKLFLVFAVATFFVACNSGASSTEATTDSTTVVTDSAAIAPAATDSAAIAPAATDSASAATTDSTKK